MLKLKADGDRPTMGRAGWKNPSFLNTIALHSSNAQVSEDLQPEFGPFGLKCRGALITAAEQATNMFKQRDNLQMEAIRVLVVRNLRVYFGLILIVSSTLGTDWAIGERVFLPEGKPFPLRSGELHYPRIPREYWTHRLQMARKRGQPIV